MLRGTALVLAVSAVGGLAPLTKTQIQQRRLNSLTGFSALVLNADYQPLSYLPLSVWSWQDAIKAVWQGRVDVVATYDAEVRSASAAFEIPSVVVLRNYEARSTRAPRYSKRLLLLRDQFTCQYCRNRFHGSQLTADHVVPRASGGKSTWDNVVASCLPCNQKKKSLLPSQLKSIGMERAPDPSPPSAFQLEAKARKFCLARYKRSDIPESWLAYLAGALDAAEPDAHDDAHRRKKRGKQQLAHRLPDVVIHSR